MGNPYIEECITSQRTVRVITTNGFHMNGKIVEDLGDCFLLSCGNIKKIVYKHAISTISPETEK